MTETTSFDPAQYKADLRTEWRNAAPGWRAWLEVLEAADGGQAVSRSLVELARIGPGDAVLDVAAGYGEPGLTAARAVAPGGHVVCTDIPAELLAVGRERAAAAGLDNLEFLEGDAEELAFGDDLERFAGGQRRGRVAVADAMQGDGDRPTSRTRRANRLVTCSGWRTWPSSRVKTKPVSVHAGPQASRSSSCRTRWALSAAVVNGSRASCRRLLAVLASATTTGRLSTTTTAWTTASRPGVASRSTARQGSPSSSLRRMPVVANSSHIAARRSSLVDSKKARSSSADQAPRSWRGTSSHGSEAAID
jgi:hypothetical protein